MMRFAVIAIAATLAATVATAGPHDDCDFTAAVGLCQNRIANAGRCDYFKCLVQHCPTTTMLDIARDFCGTAKAPNADAAKPLVAGGHAQLLRNSKPVRMADGDDSKAAAAVSQPRPAALSEEQQAVVRKLEENRERHGVTGGRIRPPASPCRDHTGDWSKTRAHQLLHAAAWVGYLQRANEHYDEGAQRWSGITGRVCPAQSGRAPTYSDCSAFVTWIYWTVFGNGPDFLNNEGWRAGYTGSLIQHGRSVPANTGALQVGDLCFYYHPMHHVAIYVGGGMIVSHGMDPVGYYQWDYAPVDYCRRYL